MAFTDQRIAIQNFRIGRPYSRAAMAAEGRVSAPSSSRDPHWSQGIVAFSNAVLLLVTLDKTARDDYQYKDYFQGGSFWWQSQNSQTQRSPVIARILRGVLEPHLFVRIRERVKGVTQPFIYCGRFINGEADGERPVTVQFDSLDYVDGPTGDLRAIYNWAPSGPSDSREAAREQAIRVRRSRGQGYQTDQEVKKKTEDLAMQRARQHYSSLGFDVTDTHANKSYDLVVTKGEESRRVEVKGTSSGGDSVEVTSGEVQAARAGPEPTDLFVLHTITITREEGVVKATGGIVRLISGWLPDDGDLRPTRFTYQVPKGIEDTQSTRAPSTKA